MKKKILFVNAILENNAPRSIRTLNFIKHLKNEYEIHILYFKFNKNRIEIPGVTIHTIKISNILKRKFLTSKSKNLFYRLVYKIHNLPNKLKDSFYFDIKNLSEKINRLDNDYNFDKMIISVSPFSLYKLIDYIATKKTTFDIGDPLFKNSSFGKSENRYFYKIEQNALIKCSKIIVTNKATKNSFILNYSINKKKIKVVTQGFDDLYIEEIKKGVRNLRTKDNVVRLVYGGRFYKGLRDPNNLVNAIQKHNISNPKLKIVFDIYGGQGIRITEGNGVKIHPSVDQKTLFKEIINSDYNVFIDNSKGIQTPGKIFENLALETPMIFIKSLEITQTFKLVEKCEGIRFVENNFNTLMNNLTQLKLNEDEIDCDFDLSKYAWPTLSFKLIK